MMVGSTTIVATTPRTNSSGVGNKTGGGEGEGEPDDVELLRYVGVVFMVIAIVAFVLNLLALLSILVNRRLRHVNAHIFIVNMASADLLYSLSVILPIGVWNYFYYWHSSFFHCQLQIYMEAAVSYVSNFSVALVAFDKYLFIAKPFRYEAWMNKRTVGLLIGLSWFIPMLETVFITWLGAEQWDHVECLVMLPPIIFQVQSVLFFLLPLFVIIVCGGLIVAIVRDHQRRIAALDVGAGPAQRVSWRAVNTVLLVVFCFLLLQAPIHMAAAIYSFCNECFSYNIIYEYLNYPLYAGSLVNPLLYVFTDRKFRRSLFLFLCCGRQTLFSADESTTDTARAIKARRSIATSQTALNGNVVVGKDSPTP